MGRAVQSQLSTTTPPTFVAMLPLKADTHCWPMPYMGRYVVVNMRHPWVFAGGRKSVVTAEEW